MRRVWMGIALAALAAVLWSGTQAAAPAGQDQLLAAMRAELERTMARLSLPDYAKPYFVAYRLVENDNYRADAILGAELSESGGRERKAYVEVRVGDYALDNTSDRSEFDSFDPDQDTFNYLDYIDLPLENDTDAIRTQLWRLTDLRFKNASAAYLNKRARAVYRENPDGELHDFTREKTVRHSAPDQPVKLDKKFWKEALREASAELKKYPALLDSQAMLQTHSSVEYLLNSEGTELRVPSFYFMFYAQARALTDDGLTVTDYYSRYARSEAGLPTKQEIIAAVRAMAEQLVALRVAPVLDPYDGPAILDPTVSGIFFHEAIGHRLEGDRTRGVDEGQTFKEKVGRKILPEFLSVIDDPTLRRFGAADLNGYYDFDQEGVPAQRVTLVERGVLRDFLRSRRPIRQADHSNGHGRADPLHAPMSRMSNLIIEAHDTVPVAQLKDKLLELARRKGKPYGLWLRQGMGGETATDQFNFQAFANRPVLLYRVDAQTGREELVRGAELVGTPLLSIGKVEAAGDDPGLFNGYCGAESGFVPVSVIAPSLLVSEIEIQRVQDKPTKPPVLPPPYADK